MAGTTGLADLQSQKEREIQNLYRMIEDLTRQRKDLSRFLDIDREKKELEGLKIEIDLLYDKKEKMIAESKLQAETIIEKAHQTETDILKSANTRLDEAGQEAAGKIASSNAILSKVIEKRDDLDRMEKELIKGVNKIEAHRAELLEFRNQLELSLKEISGMLFRLPKFN